MRLTDFEVHVLSPLKVLQDSKTVCLLVVPDTFETRTVAKRSEGILPVPPGLVGVALEHVTTREAQQALFCMSATTRERRETVNSRGGDLREPQQGQLEDRSCGPCR